MPLNDKIIDSAYRIREKCVYSDFFIVIKEEAQEQLEKAKSFFGYVEVYLGKQKIRV